LQQIPQTLQETLICGLEKYPDGAPAVSVAVFQCDEEVQQRGVIATEAIPKGTFLMPYLGDVTTKEKFEQRNQEYIENDEACMYIEVQRPFRGKKWIVDATRTYG